MTQALRLDRRLDPDILAASYVASGLSGPAAARLALLKILIAEHGPAAAGPEAPEPSTTRVTIDPERSHE